MKTFSKKTPEAKAHYTNRNIVLHELIGLKVEVLESPEKQRRHMKGIVIDETKNMLYIKKYDESVVAMPKSCSKFAFISGRKRFIVRGAEILFRPHERIEKGLKFYKARSA